MFQRTNEAGDMPWIATTVPNLDDRRAIGTYIPATTPGRFVQSGD
ncbi:MAG: Cache 3/Cache 2 fusion domain-containing protein [Syntrophotaleaceae bacterium]